MTQKVEQQLIDKALNGDVTAFSEVYLRMRGSIYGFAYRMLKETSLAEDITQEVFMFLLNNPYRFDSEKGELLPFLCGIARNKIIQYLRKHSTKSEVFEDDFSKFDEFENLENNPLEVLLKGELAEKIEHFVAELPPLQREVLILREIEGLPYSEIAEITETNLSQVKIRLHRARKSLVNDLKPYLTSGKGKFYEMY
ncbi:MAG: RNA polymerase sigma factor [Pyrinomonadaceae bacterium]|nr:RNA polymerase sigma factor [Pyrinomonadaceae bacterium]